MKKLIIILTAVLTLITGGALAIPDMMNYQGRAYSPPGSNIPVPDSTTNVVRVRIYRNQFDPIVNRLWEQTIYNVETKNGFFNVQFGGFGSVLDFSEDYWLGIEFNNDGEMTPRQKLLSAPYAGRAQFVNEINSKTNVFGPVSITSSSESSAGLTVSSTGNVAIVGINEGNISYTAGIAGYSYNLSSFTAGVYGFGMKGIGVYGVTSGTAQAGVQGDAYNGIGIHGRGVTGVVATTNDYSNGLALYTEGKSYLYGSTTIVASGGADPGSGALNIYNNAGTGFGTYVVNPPGIAMYGSGAVGMRGFGTDVGIEGIGTSGIGFGMHTYNGSADGLQSGASLYVSGKIKMDAAGGVNSPIGVISFISSDGPNPWKEVINNLCNGLYHVFVTPQGQTKAGGHPISWWVEKMSGRFRLHLETDGFSLDNNCAFSFLIINE